MKTKEEIKKLAEQYANFNIPKGDTHTIDNEGLKETFIEIYNKCQQDNINKLSEKTYKEFTLEQLIWFGVQSTCDEKCHCHAECNKADEVIEKLKSTNK